MLVTPLLGVDREHLARALEEVAMSAANLRGGVGGRASDWAVAYLRWAGQAARSLRLLVSPADVDRLVLSRRYELLFSGTGHDPSVLNDLLSIELDERVGALTAASEELRTAIQRWSRPGVFVLADTSVYIEHRKKLDDIDFAALIGVREEDIQLLVPILVVDELDGLKQSNNDHTRWRALHTIAVLDRVFTHTTAAARLRDEDFSALGSGGIPRGTITAELVFDPPGHNRLPINDDEIIARILALQPLTGRPITLLTADTGQSTRARAAGLTAIKLPEPERFQRPGRRTATVAT